MNFQSFKVLFFFADMCISIVQVSFMTKFVFLSYFYVCIFGGNTFFCFKHMPLSQTKLHEIRESKRTCNQNIPNPVKPMKSNTCNIHPNLTQHPTSILILTSARPKTNTSLWDMGGQTRNRSNWSQLCRIYIVPSMFPLQDAVPKGFY